MTRRTGRVGMLLSAAMALAGSMVVVDGGQVSADHDTTYTTIDINQLGGDIHSEWAVMVDDLLFFDSDDREHGRELWVLDTTTEQAKMVTDLAPGSASAEPYNAVAYDGMLLFNASDADGDTRAYRTDGTAVGTVPLGDWTLRDPVVFDGSLFFGANVPGDDPSGEGGVGTELFRWDLASGVELVSDLYSGTSSSSPDELTVVDGATDEWLFFLGRTSLNGEELVRYDPVGGVQIADTDAGSDSIDADHLVAAGDELYAVEDGFYAVTDVEVATFDASAVTEHPGIEGPIVRDAVGTDGGVYLIGGAFPYISLYWSVGGAAPTLVPDRCTYGPLVPFGDTVIFETAFYSSSGLCAGTSGYLARASGPLGASILLTEDRVSPEVIVANDAGDRALFFGEDTDGASKLWRTNGNEEDAEPFLDLALPDDSSVGLFADTTDFGATWWMLGSTSTEGAEWWASKSTQPGSTQVGTVSDVTGDSYAQEFAAAGDYVVFVADDGITGLDLWRYDPTSGSTSLVADLSEDDRYPYGFVSNGPLTMFETDDSLYVTDGTTLTDFVDAAGLDGWGQFDAIGDRFFLSAEVDSNGSERELYVTDGSAGGTTLVKDINPADGSYPGGFTAFGERVVFEADDGASGYEPWISDGTDVGTFLLADTIPGADDGDPSQFTVVDDLVYFIDDDDRLWQSDGTQGGTVQVTLTDGVHSATEVYEIATAGGKLFATDDGDDRLWVIDGAAITMLELDFEFDLDEASDFNGLLVSGSYDGDEGYEPAVSDGTLAGTYQIPVRPGDEGGLDLYDIVAGTYGVFMIGQGDDDHYELWRTEGTAASNEMIADFGYDYFENELESDNFMRRIGDLLFISADLPDVGGEAMIFDVGAHAPPPEPSAIVPIDPARYWDTRDEATFDGTFRDTGRLGDDDVHKIRIAGRGAVPADATGVVANLTVIFPDGPGFATIYPCTPSVPNASTLNYGPGDVIANNTVVPLDANGDVCVSTLRGADYALDINGYTPADSPIVGINPARYLETRATESTFDGNALGAGRTGDDGVVEVQIAGRGTIPADATAAIVNATIIFPDAPGFATLYPCGTVPDSSNINYAAGSVTPNGAIAQLSPTGTLCIYTLRSADIILDVSGYVPADTATITTRSPERFLDTRAGEETVDGESAGDGRNAAGDHVEVQITGRDGIPADATAAIVNLGIIFPDGPGFATLYPCGTVPGTSNLNHTTSGVVLANNAITRLSPTGSICIYTLTGADLILDVTGYLE